MKPTAEETLKVMPVTFRAIIPPKTGNGNVAICNQACRKLPKLQKSRRNISASDSGKIRISRAKALF